MKMMYRIMCRFAMMACIGGAILSFADTPATITQATDLLKKPNAKSNIVTRLEMSQQVSVTTREGGWYQVMTEDKVGWVRMFFLRFTPQSNNVSRSGIGAILSSARKPHSEVALTTGVRGISEKLLKNAKPNFDSVTAMAKFVSDVNSTKRFAVEGKLRSRKVKYIERKE